MPTDARPIVVVGSLNMDLVVPCFAIPLPGQTVAGGDLTEVPGGKGANQAVAAARLAAGQRGVRMVGRVGDDPFGRRLTGELQRDGIDAEHVRPLAGVPTGTAMILVLERGENAIVVSPGANGHLAPADVPVDVIAGAAVVLLQLETPLATVAAAAGRGAFVILDPAPVPAGGVLLAELYAVHLITPNQTEAEALTGIAVRSVDDAHRAAEVLIARGAKAVLIKLGSAGCAISTVDAGQVVTRHVGGFAVDVIDSTAAGDTFNGALAVALAEGLPLERAARFANAAGALAGTKPGAQSSIPTRAEVERLIVEQRKA